MYWIVAILCFFGPVIWAGNALPEELLTTVGQLGRWSLGFIFVVVTLSATTRAKLDSVIKAAIPQDRPRQLDRRFSAINQIRRQLNVVTAVSILLAAAMLVLSALITQTPAPLRPWVNALPIGVLGFVLYFTVCWLYWNDFIADKERELNVQAVARNRNEKQLSRLEAATPPQTSKTAPPVITIKNPHGRHPAG